MFKTLGIHQAILKLHFKSYRKLGRKKFSRSELAPVLFVLKIYHIIDIHGIFIVSGKGVIVDA